MRQQTATQPTTLRALVDAISDQRLCALVRELANGSSASAPAAIIDPIKPAKPTKRQRKGWPRGKLRGPRKAMLAMAEKKAAKAKRAAERKRERRAEARAQREAGKVTAGAGNATKTASTDNIAKTANGGNGAHNNAGKNSATAKALWEHATKLSAKTPWIPVSNTFELNRAMVLDCFRTHSLPPGVTADEVGKFLELPAG